MESMLEAFFIIRYNIVETYLNVFYKRFYFIYQKDHVLAKYPETMP